MLHVDPHIKNIIFDFGGVLIDWNPRYLYRSYFGSDEEMEYFLQHICTMEWNAQMDAGRPFADAVGELAAQYPQYAEPIGMYHTRWYDMIGGTVEKGVEWLRAFKREGYHLYGLTNWSMETLPTVMARYDFFTLLDGFVASGEEHLLKPDARIYRRILDRYHLRAEECLFIDDSKTNIDGAAKVGLAVHLFEASEMRQTASELGADWERTGSDHDRSIKNQQITNI
ncbi:MAG: HAD family phosphatase [Bacteroidales bacterium]|nr:HAD family phosphatase [Bacteroidales bacterium]